MTTSLDKPHIYLWLGTWTCKTDRICATGPTPAQSYEAWSVAYGISPPPALTPPPP